MDLLVYWSCLTLCLYMFWFSKALPFFPLLIFFQWQAVVSKFLWGHLGERLHGCCLGTYTHTNKTKFWSVNALEVSKACCVLRFYRKKKICIKCQCPVVRWNLYLDAWILRHAVFACSLLVSLSICTWVILLARHCNESKTYGIGAVSHRLLTQSPDITEMLS